MTDRGVRLSLIGRGDIAASVDVILLGSRIVVGAQRTVLNSGAIVYWKAGLSQGAMECTGLSDAHGKLAVNLTDTSLVVTDGGVGRGLHGTIEADLECIVKTRWQPRLKLSF